MISGAMVIVECNECCTVRYIDLVPAGTGTWKTHGLRNELVELGWEANWDDLHLCPNCCKENRDIAALLEEEMRREDGSMR